MKRTAEMILTSVGIAFSFIGVVLTSIGLFFMNSDLVRESMERDFREDALKSGESYNAGDADIAINLIVGFGWVVFSFLLIAVILGVIALFFYTGNKKPKAASIIMITASVVVCIGTIFMGFVPALLFLVAGIVGLVRKPPVQSEVMDQ